MQHTNLPHTFTISYQLLECNAGETNATTVTASLLGPDDTSTDVVIDSQPDTVALDWRDISCSIYKVGCCQDCPPSYLWSYPWLQRRLSTAMSVVISMATLLMQTSCICADGYVHGCTAQADFLHICVWSCPWLHCSCRLVYSHVCDDVHGYTAHAEFSQSTLWSCLWLHKTFIDFKIQDKWCPFKYLEREGIQEKKISVLTKTTFAHVSMRLCKLIMAPGYNCCSCQKALNLMSRHPGCHSLELCIVYPGAVAEGPEPCDHCCKALARGKPHLTSIGSLGCSRQHSMREQQRVTGLKCQKWPFNKPSVMAAVCTCNSMYAC